MSSKTSPWCQGTFVPLVDDLSKSTSDYAGPSSRPRHSCEAVLQRSSTLDYSKRSFSSRVWLSISRYGNFSANHHGQWVKVCLRQHSINQYVPSVPFSVSSKQMGYKTPLSSIHSCQYSNVVRPYGYYSRSNMLTLLYPSVLCHPRLV